SSGGFGDDGAAGTDAAASTDRVTRVWSLRPLATSTSACATALATSAVCFASVPVAVISTTGASGDVDAVTWESPWREFRIAAARSVTGPVRTIRPYAWAKFTATGDSPAGPVTTTYACATYAGVFSAPYAPPATAPTSVSRTSSPNRRTR